MENLQNIRRIDIIYDSSLRGNTASLLYNPLSFPDPTSRQGDISVTNIGSACSQNTENKSFPKPMVSVIVPVFNEENTVQWVLNKLNCLDFVKEVIVVDDGSTDLTSAKVDELRLSKVQLIRLEKNTGKTAAVRRGLRNITREITIIQDADNEYDPTDIQDVIHPILINRADVVYGSRFLVKRASRVLYFYHYLANKTLTLLSNLFTNVNFTDIETCYKAFRSPLIKGLPISSRKFGMEIEITALISRTRARIYEVPISYYGRNYEEGKKIRARDGLAAFWQVFYYNLIAPHTAARRQYIREANTYLNQLRDAISEKP